MFFVNDGYVKVALHIGAKAHRLVMYVSDVKAKYRCANYKINEGDSCYGNL